MSLNANVLKSNESQRKAIASEVNNILGRMDDDIKKAHEENKRSVSLTVPIVFSVPYMSNTDAQRVIYYKILISLIDRNFGVKISMGGQKTIFHVKWITEEELKEIEEQNALLAKYTIKDK